MKLGLIAIAAFTLLTGCVGIIKIEPEEDDRPVNVNTYVNAPKQVLRLIEPYVQDYFSPSLSRYCTYLYPKELWNNQYNYPCFVRADFNGDNCYDYAFLFSKEEWSSGKWYVTTKILVVLTTSNGYKLCGNESIGTAFGDASVPVAEFWSIRFVPAGYHELIVINNGQQEKKSVFLENDGFFMASLDPKDESIFYCRGITVYQLDWNYGAEKGISSSFIERKKVSSSFKDYQKTENRYNNLFLKP